ncbi:hypothetical protein [Limnobacter sp.]|uniref:hypothetical protein n=1 Tax=Limnobacter sp. TaxID=2003368 RepID=UPI002FDFF0B6
MVFPSQSTCPYFPSDVSPPLSRYDFQHKISHVLEGLASTLQRAESQVTYNLNANDGRLGHVSQQALDKSVTSAKQAVLRAFDQQHQARKHTGQSRLELVRTLNLEPDARGDDNPLNAFNVEESLLPPLASSSPGKARSQPSNNSQNTKSKAEKHHSHEHEHGGGIVIDLDEAAHGAFASSKYLSEVAQGRPETVAATFKENAAQMGEQPIRYLGKELTESGVTEFATAASAGALMLPLAALAVKAGVEEWQHSGHELKELNALRLGQEEELTQLQATTHGLDSNTLLKTQVQAQEVRLDKTAQAIRQTRKDREIGAMSAASGLTIGLKALSDLALKISIGIKGALTGKGFFALSESAQTGSTAAGAAVGFGIAGTFVLGPLAGLFATALGAFFTIKTMGKFRQLKHDFAHLKADIKTDALTRTGNASEASETLRSFLIRQGEKRIGFFKRFARWNKAFMVGSGLYAASAVTKAVVVGVAAAGVVAAASNPIGLAVLTAVGIVGSLAMGVASFSFFRGHGKQSKYTGVTAADHAWVDRKLMTELHGMQTANIYHTALGETENMRTEHAGFDMATTCLKYLNTQKRLLREFLGHTAQSCNKKSPLNKKLSLWQHLGGRVLKNKELRAFLATENGKQRLKDMVKHSLIAKSQMLSEKLRHRELLLQIAKNEVNGALFSNNPPVNSSDAQNTLTQLKQVGEVLQRLDGEYGKDQAELELSLLRLKNIEFNSEHSVLSLAEYLDAGSNHKAVSKYLHQKMDGNIRQARGVLFESQLEGARLRDKQFNALKETK